DRVILPTSPPLPLIHRILRSEPSSGSRSFIFELVLPPPKFVMRRSEPRRLERYRSSSASLNLRSICSSQRSSKNCSFSCTFTELLCTRMNVQPWSASDPSAEQD